MKKPQASRRTASGQKRTKISKQLILRLAVVIFTINVIVLFVVGGKITRVLEQLEQDYLQEISDNISSTVESVLSEYLTAAAVLAKNDSIIQILEQSDKANPMNLQDLAPSVISQMENIALEHPEEILFIGIFDVEQDGYLMHDGDYSGSDFSFQEWDYYAPVQTQQAYVSSPYLDTEIDDFVISLCYPVFSQGGQVLGITLIDMSISFVAQLISDSTFGSSGTSFVLDEYQTILAHSNASYIGQPVSALGLVGDGLTQEFSSSSQNLLEYSQNSVKMIGVASQFPNYDWTILTSKTYQEFNVNNYDVLGTLFLMQNISIVVTLVIAAITVAHALLPLDKINTAMEELAKGNIHYKLDYESRNEIGQVADNLRYTMENLATYIDEIERQLESYSHGDFTVDSQLDFVGDFAKIQHAIQEFKRLISSALDGIKATVTQVSLGSDYVASGSQNLAEGSAEQSESINVLNQNLSHITVTVEENVESVKHVNSSSQQVAEDLQKSNEKMHEMVASMSEINRTSEGIQKIIKTIEDVAFQTNILALNAAVEAARASTAGRGFAVVAEEVRNLATRTSQAVQETRQLIGETDLAVKQGSLLAQETAQGLEDVITFMGSFMGSLNSITSASENQATAIQEISDNVDEITKVLQQNSAISEQSAATSEELSGQATVMKETISQFRTMRDLEEEQGMSQ